MMTDQEIIQGLIARDNRVTKEFFFDKCRLEKPRAFDPRGQAVLTPSGKI